MTFELMCASSSGPARRVATFADPRVACIAAYRRCRMYSGGKGVPDQALGDLASRDAHYASVDHVAEDGTRTLLIEFRRVTSEQKVLGVSVLPSPALDPSRYFALSRGDDGSLLIEAPLEATT